MPNAEVELIMRAFAENAQSYEQVVEVSHRIAFSTAPLVPQVVQYAMLIHFMD